MEGNLTQSLTENLRYSILTQQTHSWKRPLVIRNIKDGVWYWETFCVDQNGPPVFVEKLTKTAFKSDWLVVHRLKVCCWALMLLDFGFCNQSKCSLQLVKDACMHVHVCTCTCMYAYSTYKNSDSHKIVITQWEGNWVLGTWAVSI